MRLGAFLAWTAAVFALSAPLAFAGGAAAEAEVLRVGAEGRSGDVVSLGRHIVVDGGVSGTVVSVGGEISVDGHVTGDVVSFFGDVTLGASARVEGDVLAVAGRVIVPPGAEPSRLVGGRRLSLEALEAAYLTELQTSPLPSSASSSLLLAFRLLLLAIWLVAGLALLRLAPRRVLGAAAAARRDLPFLALVGLSAVLAGALVSALALAVAPPRVAILLAALVVAGLAVAKVFGVVALFVVAGRRLNRRAPRGALLFGEPAALALGLLALGVVSLVPLAGPVLWIALSLVGIGVALRTGFGSPALLADSDALVFGGGDLALRTGAGEAAG